MSQPARSRTARSGSVTVAAVLVLAESLALLCFAVLDLTSLTSERLGLGVGTAVFFCAYAGGQAYAAASLLRLAGWARGPLVFTQLIQLGLAWGLRDGPPWLAGLLALAALVVLVCLLRPSTTALLDKGSSGRTTQ